MRTAALAFMSGQGDTILKSGSALEVGLIARVAGEADKVWHERLDYLARAIRNEIAEMLSKK